MSAYARQLERDISFLSQSAPSTRTSELGSHYEPGFTISAITATILIGALLVAGVSLIALLTALTIMLHSCQSQSSGVVDLSDSKAMDHSMCKILAMHAELNSLSGDEIPLKCKEDATRYITSGKYARDLEFAINLAVGYFSCLEPQTHVLDIILMDADDCFPSVRQNSIIIIKSSFIVEADAIKHIMLLELYKSLQVKGWQVILVSRRPFHERNATIDYLASSGYTNWLLLIMRSDHEVEMDSTAYMGKQRTKLEEEGQRVVGIVSSQMDAFSGIFSGKKMFKIPSHVYYHF